MIDQLKKLGCNCYVGTLPEEKQFSLRWGAHAKDCPVYRPSLDPIDARYDEAFRETHMHKTAARELPAVEIKLLTIVRLPQYGAALVIAVMPEGKQEIFYGPQNADGSVHFNEDEFVVLDPKDIIIRDALGGFARN